MARRFPFDGARLVQALAATFEGRPAPTDDIPLSLTTGFYSDTTRGERWRTYLAKRGRLRAPVDFGTVGELVKLFLTPPWYALSHRDRFATAWPPGGPWQPATRSAQVESSEVRAQIERAQPRRFRPYPEYKDSGVEWLGEIPTHWSALPIKRICRFRYGDSLAADDRADGNVVVFGSNGPVGSHDAANTVAPCLIVGRKGSFGKVNYSAEAVFAIDTTFAIDARCTREDLRWLYYTLQSARLDMASKDSAIPGLDREDAYARAIVIVIVIGPIREQGAIAAFLDRETAKIDGLVARKERLIELLREKRTALITRAVTRGLDPNVPMKDSGVEWLGEIPAHWEVRRLRRVVSKFVDYRGKTPEKSPSGARLVTAKNVKNQSIDFSLSEEFIPEDLYPQWMVRGRPERGDVLITTEAPLGETAQILDVDIALAQRIILLKVNTTRITNDYLKYHFAADPGHMELCTRATGSTALGIKASHLKASLVAVPPVCEQEEISRTVDSGTVGVDLLIAKVHRAINHLNEFRTALISAAVTGKIDVRTVSAEATAGQGGTAA